jgi:2-oxoisovalerate dehydrogenase E1 component
MEYTPPPDLLSNKDLSNKDFSKIDQALLLSFTWMHFSRMVDDRIHALFRQGLVKGTAAGGQGNEGLAVPIALLLNKEKDVVSWTHRGLGGHLIWSGHLGKHLSQYLANSESPTKAREGNVHHGDPANRSYPMLSHLGAMCSNVVGGVDSQRRNGIDAIGVTFIGDGSSSTGDIHESMNIASVFSIPTIFIIENNHYAYSTPTSEQYACDKLVQRASSYGMEGISLDTSDTEETLKTLSNAFDKVRETGKPLLIEAQTLRLRGHTASDTCDYLPKGQNEKWAERDALFKLRNRLLKDGFEKDILQIEKELTIFLEKVLNEAISHPPPLSSIEDLTKDIFSSSCKETNWLADNTTQTLTLAQAIQKAHQKILSESPESILMGQDIAGYGGPFKTTKELFNEFGRERVINTPLAESATVGYATGLALNGHRPIIEFQFADFATDATTQILLNAATYHFRSGAKVPLVLRFPCGGGLTFGSFHSQDLESIYLHAPGLKVLYPSTPQDAYNALLAAYEDDNPVLLFEHKALYRSKGSVSFDPDYQSVWKPRHVTSGKDGTIVTYGEMTLYAQRALAYLEDEYEYTFDLFDLRALSPIDLTCIKESLSRTHRLAVIHEARRTAGFGAEIVSQLVEELFFDLESPPLRIASLDTPVPFAPELEAIYRPSQDSIIESLISWME